jgi:hypothetical protein
VSTFLTKVVHILLHFFLLLKQHFSLLIVLAHRLVDQGELTTYKKHPGIWSAVCALHPSLDSVSSWYYGLLAVVNADQHICVASNQGNFVFPGFLQGCFPQVTFIPSQLFNFCWDFRTLSRHFRGSAGRQGWAVRSYIPGADFMKHFRPKFTDKSLKTVDYKLPNICFYDFWGYYEPMFNCFR